VDVESGEVTVLRVVAAHDCGRIVNPTMVDSQVIGAVTQGIGFALTEERVVDAASCIVVNANIEEYKMLTVADVPEIIHAQVDMADVEANPPGAKGIGEPPLVPAARNRASAKTTNIPTICTVSSFRSTVIGHLLQRRGSENAHYRRQRLWRVIPVRQGS